MAAVNATLTVPELLTYDNYDNWSACLKNYLIAQDLWDIVESPPMTDEELPFSNLRRKNAAALHAILISCGPILLSDLGDKKMSSANTVWNRLIEIDKIPKHSDEDIVDQENSSPRNVHSPSLPHANNSAELVQAINKGDLEEVKRMIEGELSSRTEIVMGQKDAEGNIPVVSASNTGHKKLTIYLYSHTPRERLMGTDGSSLICSTIMNNIFDVALDLIRRYPNLATVRSQSGMVPLEALSKMPSVFRSGSRLSFWRQIVFRCLPIQLPAREKGSPIQLSAASSTSINIQPELKPEKSKLLRVIRQTLLKILGIEELYEMKFNQLCAIDILNCMCQEIPNNSQPFVKRAFFRGIKNGMVELVANLCKANPELLYLKNVKNNNRTIFFLAIQYRQENIFNLIYGLTTEKGVTEKDGSKNNMLHIAGLMAPPNRLAHISGAALKMQRQLQWYKEVERVVNPSYKPHRNCVSEQPHELFSKQHNELKKQGEAWMKENATSCSIVAALIITVMFAAVFTIPGGNNQNTGYPMFLRKTQLQVFVIADLVSLFSSTTSVLMFQGILTSRYAEEDFLKSLPTKLMIGLSTLFISIAAMMVEFCAALIIMFKGQVNIVVPSVVLASLPIAAFLWLQSPLLIEIFMSTYGPSIFNRKMKPRLVL